MQNQKNRIICTKWGSGYGDKDIVNLYNSVQKNCSVDIEFECFENLESDWEDYKWKHYRASNEPDYRKDMVQNNYHRDDFGGIPHYRKILLFELDKKFNPNDKILYLDLDTLITGDLAYFFEDLNIDKPYIVWNYWWDHPYFESGSEWKRQYSITRCPLFNSSTMLWKPGQNKPIYNHIAQYTDEVFFTYPSMDTFMFHNFGPCNSSKNKNHFQYFDEGIITSERINSIEDGEAGIIHMLEGLSNEEKSKYV